MNRCSICRKRYDERCPRCEPMRELFGDKFGLIEEWVRAIANDVSEDAILGHLNDEDHS